MVDVATFQTEFAIVVVAIAEVIINVLSCLIKSTLTVPQDITDGHVPSIGDGVNV
jgi:hypothetical protein